MMVLVTDPEATDHRAGPHHPESPERLGAVLRAADAPEWTGAVRRQVPTAASRADLERVHVPELVDRIEALRGRSGRIDPDTGVSPASVDIAERAAGAGLVAVAELEAGRATTAFCAVRPPGHHATPSRSMGFCLFNNIAVTAAALVERGERVVIADVDAHHGNGTQDVFWNDPRVLFVSWHQSPLYPGTGRLDEIGGPDAPGTTVNVPLAPGSTGDAYRSTLDQVVGPIIEDFGPTWLLISAGFDAHRRDPLTEMGLSAGDYGDVVADLTQVVPPGRTIAFLEGGYDLEALEWSAAATIGALLGERVHPEAPTTGGSTSGRLRELGRAVAGAQGRR